MPTRDKKELVQQRAREARAKNIIIHGFPESCGENEEEGGWFKQNSSTNGHFGG